MLIAYYHPVGLCLLDALAVQINTVLIAYYPKMKSFVYAHFYLSHLIDASYFFECGILAFFVSSDSFFFLG